MLLRWGKSYVQKLPRRCGMGREIGFQVILGEKDGKTFSHSGKVAKNIKGGWVRGEEWVMYTK